MGENSFFITTPTIKLFAGLYPPAAGVLEDEEPHRSPSR
jgi:hypothetical protein